MKYKRLVIIYTLLVLLALILSVWMSHIYAFNPTFDDIYSLSVIKNSYSDIFKSATRDLHPPLYYLGLKAFADLFTLDFDSYLAFRFFSILGYISAILLCCFPVRRMWGNTVAVFSILLFLFLPNFFYNYILIRMYTWVVFFTLASVIYAFDAYKNNTIWAWCKLTLFSIGSLFIHYYAGLVSFIVYSILFCFLVLEKSEQRKNKLIKFFTSGFIILLVYLPSFLQLLAQMSNVNNDETWLSTPSIRELFSAVQYYFSPKSLNEFYPSTLQFPFVQIVILLLLALQVVIMIYSTILYRKSDKNIKRGWIVLTIFILPIFMMLVYTFSVRSIFLVRYLLSFTGLYVLSFAFFLAVMYKNKKGKPLIALFFTLLIYDYGILIYNNYSRNNLEYIENLNSSMNNFIKESGGIIYGYEGSYIPFLELSYLYPNAEYRLITTNCTTNTKLSVNYWSGDTITLYPFVNIKKIQEVDLSQDFLYTSFVIQDESIMKHCVIVDSISRPYFLYKLRKK